MNKYERKAWANLLRRHPEAVTVPRFSADFCALYGGAPALSSDARFVLDWEARTESGDVAYRHYFLSDDPAFSFPVSSSHALDLIPQRFVLTLTEGADARTTTLNYVRIGATSSGKWRGDRVIDVAVSQPVDGICGKTQDGALSVRIEWDKGPDPNPVPDKLKPLYRVLAVVQSAYCGGPSSILADPSTLVKHPTKQRLSAHGAPSVRYSKVDLTLPSYRSEVSLGGTHASPRWHMRRGHWRRYKSGKQVWISLTEVGDKSRGRVVKEYLIGQHVKGEQHAIVTELQA